MGLLSGITKSIGSIFSGKSQSATEKSQAKLTTSMPSAPNFTSDPVSAGKAQKVTPTGQDFSMDAFNGRWANKMRAMASQDQLRIGRGGDGKFKVY
jgi:hypothetical protein